MGSRAWFKVSIDRWLRGTIRDEPPEYRGLWIDLLALAGSSLYGDEGRVEVMPGVGLSQVQLSDGFKVQHALWAAFEQRMIETERITIDEKRVITICNWKNYQSEYQRQKQYRQAAKVTNEGYNQRLQGEREREREREREKKETKQKKRTTVRKPHEYPVAFDRIWAVLGPLRPDHNKKRALHAWQARKREGIDPDDLLKAAENFAEAMEGREAQHIKHGATFLGPNEEWQPYLDGVPDLEGDNWQEKLKNWQPPEERNAK